MTDKEIRILRVFAEVIPTLPEDKQNYLLGYGDGIIAARETEKKKPDKEVPVA